MKKILLLMMCCPMILSAQNGVTVSNLDVRAGTVTFNVSWNDEYPEDFLWSDSVWVFVDYNNAGKMERLPLSGATLIAPSWSAASIIVGEDGNYSGAWVIGNAKTAAAGSFSTKVQLLTETADLSGVCAYASNYPPVGEYIDATYISFTGTLPYDLVLASVENSARTYSINDSYYTLHGGDTLKSFRDKTGAPGKMKCIVPDNPTGISNSHCGEGEVTISAASTSTVAVIDWYDMSVGGTPLLRGSNNYTTPSIGTSTTYYAQARDTITHCVSASRTLVAAIINTIPNLALSSGTATANQTVDQNTPIVDVIYTAASAIIALSSGSASLPTDVSGTPNGSTFTISGTPTAAGTFNYTVTATHTDGGCTSTLSDVIMVLSTTPPYAASTQIWTTSHSAGTLIWSDEIEVPACSTTTWAYNNNLNCTNCANGGYIYNGYYVRTYADVLCPSPWRLPSNDDFCLLTMSIENLTQCPSESKFPSATYRTLWGAKPKPYITSSCPASAYDDITYYWSSHHWDGTHSSYWSTNSGRTIPIWHGYTDDMGAGVRCVRDPQ
jgi:uncharacterized protein (TIGR02145 family)